VAKATGVQVAKIAARLMAGGKLATFAPQLVGMSTKHMSVKAPVFPFNRFPGVDPLLGPEMKSTGEVMGIDHDLGHAIAKSQLAAGMKLPTSGKVFLSVKDEDKHDALTLAQSLLDMGFSITATGGTWKFLKDKGLNVTRINKVLEGQPHIVDALINGQVALVINTTSKSAQALADSFSIRRMALMNKIPYYTLITAARAAIQGIQALQTRELNVAPLQSYFKPSSQSQQNAA
jgi:carbamoyl-phosphate synthase large subunit